LDAFQVVPDYDMFIMKDKQTLFDIKTNILTSKTSQHGNIQRMITEAFKGLATWQKHKLSLLLTAQR
jgi:hypothetical protein